LFVVSWLIVRSPEDQAWARIQGRGVITFATDPTYLPFEALDAEGNFFGFDIDLARAVAGRLGLKAEFEAVSGKGAYMRSLARDLAVALGTVGHVSALRRTAVGPFHESQAISLDKLESLGHSAPLSGHLLPVETVLDDIPALALTEREARKLSHGQAIPVLPVASRSPFKNIGQGDVVRAMVEGRLVALAKIKGGEIRPFRVINL